MKIKYQLLSFLFAVGISSLTFAATSALSSKLMVTDLNKPVLIKKSTSILILELSANPGTGFSWFLTKYNPYLIEPVSEKFKPSNKAVIGSGGFSIWEFALKPQAFKVPQISKLELEYTRPWEAGQNLGDHKKQVITFVTQ